MGEPPREPGEAFLTRRHWRDIFALGGVIAACVLGAMVTCLFPLGRSAEEATTVAFLTLAMAQLWHVFSMRSRGSGRVRNEITGNPWIWAALALCFALLALAVHWAPLARVLSVVDPGASGWATALGFSLLPLLVGQRALGSGRTRRGRSDSQDQVQGVGEPGAQVPDSR